MATLNYNQLKQLGYAFILTNSYGFKLQDISDPLGKKKLRLEYSQTLLSRLNIDIKVENAEKLPADGQYLLFSNHRSIIDPLIIDIALKDTKIFGRWVAKKELYNSPFFGMAIRNGGCIRLDRGNSRIGQFFSDIKDALDEGSSIFIFPEGTRNKTSANLLEFKDGVRIIALRNKLPLLPVYIKSNSGEVLKRALKNSANRQEITIAIGDILNYKGKENLETLYRKMFSLESKQR